MVAALVFATPSPYRYSSAKVLTRLAGAAARLGAGGYVSDIFNEVDEEVRREQLKKLWERYGNLIIGLAILVVAAVAGWRGYEYWQSRKAAEAGASYEAALKLSDDGKHTEAEAALAKLAAQGTSGYRTLARLRDAAELGVTDPRRGLPPMTRSPGSPASRCFAISRLSAPRFSWSIRRSSMR